jgi:hypothetical protein
MSFANRPKGKKERLIFPLILTSNPVIPEAVVSIFDLKELISNNNRAMNTAIKIKVTTPATIISDFFLSALMAFTL